MILQAVRYAFVRAAAKWLPPARREQAETGAGRTAAAQQRPADRRPSTHRQLLAAVDGRSACQRWRPVRTSPRVRGPRRPTRRRLPAYHARTSTTCAARPPVGCGGRRRRRRGRVRWPSSVTVMNAGKWPAWSSATVRLQPALRPPELRPRNIDRHRSITVESSEYSGFLNRNPCPGDIDRQRSSSAPNRSRHSSHGFSAFTRASDDRDTSPMPRWHGLCDCADRFDTMSPKGAALRQPRHPHRHELAPPRQLARPPPRPVHPCQPLEIMSRHQLEQAPEYHAIVRQGLDPLCFDWFSPNTITPHGRSKPPISKLMGQ